MTTNKPHTGGRVAGKYPTGDRRNGGRPRDEYPVRPPTEFAKWLAVSPLTVDEVAHKVGVTVGTVYAYSGGKNNPPATRRIKIHRLSGGLVAFDGWGDGVGHTGPLECGHCAIVCDVNCSACGQIHRPEVPE